MLIPSMPFIERTYLSTQPLQDAPPAPVADAAATEELHADGSMLSGRAVATRPRTAIGHFARLTRANAAVALTIPAFCGATLGWWESGQFHAAAFFALLASILTAAMGVHLLHDYIDFKRSFASDKISDSQPFFGAYGMIRFRRIKASEVRQLGRVFLFFSLMSSVMLALLVGWPALIIVLFSLFLGLTYGVPPACYGWRGWGLGEIGLFVGLGVLPVLAGFYTQTQTLSLLALWVSFPFGLFAMLVMFNHNLVYQRRDWLNRKRTLPVHLGLERGVDLSTAIVTLGYVGIIMTVAVARLPLWTLSCLATLPMALGAFSRLRHEVVSMDDFIHLYHTSISAVTLTGILFSLALWADRVL